MDNTKPGSPLGHGGKRTDAGRKPLTQNESTQSSRITMPASYWQFVRELGQGNASLGIRRLIEGSMANHE